MIEESQVRLAIRDEFDEAVEYVRPRKPADTLDVLDAAARAGSGFAVHVPSATETRWFQGYCFPWEVRFLRGRVRLDGRRTAPPYPSAIVVMGPMAEQGCLCLWDLRGYPQENLLGRERLLRRGRARPEDVARARELALAA